MSLLGIARPGGRHRAVDEVHRLRAELDQERARTADLRRQLDTATTGWDAANAKASQYRDERDRAVEATRQNQQAVSSLTAHPAVTETQPIPVVPLHLAPFASTSPAHVPGI
ncbi:hypothetical protein GT352_27955 [Streptomyces sp. SID1046]|uniref:hypothetical protein n=1 Tax=Streptomyces sp. SID1046 TaxID=2690249 RepID=UPI0013718FDB|nr:hypothetical protein [Streptomyces sp. SID1046]MYV77735.1 hypothetical protein [Streptomyces sp. SID1046]